MFGDGGQGISIAVTVRSFDPTLQNCFFQLDFDNL